MRSIVPFVGIALAALTGGCSATPPHTSAGAASPGGMTALHRQDIQWLERVTFGLDSADLAQYRRLGRAAYLERQLHPQSITLPPPIAAEIGALDVTKIDVAARLADVNARYQAANALAEGPEREQVRKDIGDTGNQLAYQAIRRDVLRAVYSPAQLEEQMVWFWLNHFSVYQSKERLKWLVGDYEERAIRPHVFGHFRDLVLATLEHPAMLQYLDNQRNAAGHVNENYAREILELHTLGVDGGYTQEDVQNLARVLTGVGINTGDPPHLKSELQSLYVRRGAFEFNPGRHDFGPKVLFGRAVSGRGFDEVSAAVAAIVARPACARFISSQLATYFVADVPPPALVERMASVFMHSDGDITAVLRTLFMAPEFDSALGGKFKDPMRFVVSAVRFAYDGGAGGAGPAISNTRPILNWLNGLGEAPYGRTTPDGFPLTESHWASSGQMSRRFEIARGIGAGNAGLFDTEDAAVGSGAGFPQLSNRLYFEAVEPFLSARTKQALARAATQQEWNTFLLSSPEFNYE